MWAYLVLLVVLGIILAIAGNALRAEWLVSIGLFMIAAAVVVGAFYGSYVFLLWAQMWPFQPQ